MIFNQGKSPQKNSEQSCKENQLLQAIGVSSWSELSNRPQLWLYNLGLKQLPDRLCTLMQLQQLFIEGNNIEFLPENIGCLKNLKLLAVDNNQIRSLPQSLSALKDLTLLRIEENKIEIISQSLAELKQLRKFYFHGNPLKHLPSFLQKLPNLECTDMDLQALPQQQYLECPQLSGLKNVEIYIWHLTINEGIKMKMFQQAKPRNLQLYFQSRHK